MVNHGKSMVKHGKTMVNHGKTMVNHARIMVNGFPSIMSVVTCLLNVFNAYVLKGLKCLNTAKCCYAALIRCSSTKC
jgi:hypothetical protein